jgi:uncharacterized OB-fold protein
MTTSTHERSIDPNLFTWPDSRPALNYSYCQDCDGKQFPAALSCEACGSENVATDRLPAAGTLWTWTVQNFMPKTPYKSSETPETFKPYGVAYMEFESGLKIEGRVLSDDPKSLRIGQAMEVAFYPHRIDEDGATVMNYAFKPV